MGLFKELLILSGISLLVIYGAAFVKALAQVPQPDIVFCSASWCSGCQKMKPVIKKIEALGYKVYHAKQSEWKSYGVRYIPTTIIYQNGKEVKRFVGYASYKKLAKYLPKKASRYDIGFFGRPYDPDSIRMEKRLRELIVEGYSVNFSVYDALSIYNIRRYPTTIIFLNGYEVKRFEGLVSKAEIKAYLSRRIATQKTKKIKIVLAGYDDRRFSISVIGRVLKKQGVELVHIEEKDYPLYDIETTPTIIFYEDGVEKYRLCSS